MSNTGVKTSEIPSVNSVSTADKVILVTDVSSSPVTKTTTVGTLFSNTANLQVIAKTLIINNTATPSNSTATTIQGGTVFFDNNYIYIATSNNIVKRVALSSF